jgi:sugar phosphate isomerase/epimerase
MKTSLLYFFCVVTTFALAQNNKLPTIGMASSFENDSLINVSGFQFFMESTAKCVSPKTVSEEQFQKNLSVIKKLKTPLYAFNIFIPAELKVVGPEVKEDLILAYTEEVFKRCQSANVKVIVWGSSVSRRVPDGFDRAKAREQFISIAKKIAAQAKQYNTTLMLESLNTTEANFIVTVAEALDIVKRVNHPNLRLCVDIYHMLKNDEGPKIILKTKKYIAHCEIAEKEARTPPGTKGDDFKPYLRALKKINYTGNIALECRWENLATQGKPAYEFLSSELKKIYAEK